MDGWMDERTGGRRRIGKQPAQGALLGEGLGSVDWQQGNDGGQQQQQRRQMAKRGHDQN
jgi:hypothetical protein